MAFLIKWFVIDRVVAHLVRHSRVRTHPLLQHAAPLYQSARPHVVPVVVRRVLLGAAIAAVVVGALFVVLVVMLLQAIL